MNADILALLRRRQYLGESPFAHTAGEPLNATNLDFRGLSLAGVDLSGIFAADSNLTGVCLIEADLYASNFAHCRFVKADLSRAVLNKATVVYSDFTQAVLRQAKLIRTDLAHTTFYKAVLDGADLLKAYLVDADLRGASLRGCNIRYVNFDQIRAAGIDLQGAVEFWEEREHTIDISPTEEPEILTGSAARDWLKRRIQGEGSAGPVARWVRHQPRGGRSRFAYRGNEKLLYSDARWPSL